jgi:hypothetical protein
MRNNTYIPDNAFIYHPVKDDPLDQKLALFINQMPYEVRDKMRFERESEGIYKYGKKRVFMKIEKDQIIIRVGGGYLTIEEFIEQYCDAGNSADSTKKRLFGLIYGGNCQGSKDFKTFYFTQKTVALDSQQHQNANIPHHMLQVNTCKPSQSDLVGDDTTSTSTGCLNINTDGGHHYGHAASHGGFHNNGASGFE